MKSGDKPLQGEFLYRHLMEATNYKTQDSIAIELSVKAESLSRWINGTRPPSYQSLLTVARMVFEKNKSERDFRDFEKDFVGSFRFLEKVQKGEIRDDAEAPNLARQFLDEKKTLISEQPRLTPPRQTGQDYHFATRHLKVLGREEEERHLRDFRDAGPGFRWMQLAGSAGQGKSRLAYDLIEDTDDDWASGFIKDEDLAAFKDHWEHWTPDKPHLIVVDYVVGNEADLKPMLQALAGRKDRFDVAVFLLLLERQAWSDSGANYSREPRSSDKLSISFHRVTSDWYAKLTIGKDGLDKGLDDARFSGWRDRHQAGVVELGNLRPDELLEIVRQLDEEHLIAISDDEINTYLREMDAEGRPLYAYFLAHALIEGGFQADWKHGDILTWFLRREREIRWKDEFDIMVPDIGDDAPKLEGENDQNPAMRIALLATMVGGLDCRNLPQEDYWSRPNSKVRRQALILSDGVVPGSTPPMEIPARQPDLLGDWFVLASIDHGQSLAWLADAAWHLAPRKMATFLERLSRDFPRDKNTEALLNHEPIETAGKLAFANISASLVMILDRSHTRVPAGVIRGLEWASKAGDSLAMGCLGSCYKLGIGVEADAKKAVEFFRKAVEHGDSRSYFNLGLCYMQGIGVKKDAAKGAKLFHQGVEAGDGMAMAALGLGYRDGIGVEADPKKAIELFRQGVQAKNGNAMSMLGRCYETGDGVEVDPNKAVELYRQGVDARYGRAMVNLGMCYMYGVGVTQNAKKGAALFLQGSKIGDLAAMNNLAFCFRNGTGVERDDTKAVELYRQGVMAEDGAAMASLGVCYQVGIGVDVNVDQAVALYIQGIAAENGFAMACLGKCFEDGIGVMVDPRTSVALYRRGVEAKDGRSMAYLGRCYEIGLGVEPGAKTAVELYRKGSDADEPEAMLHLGKSYVQGRGIEKNLSEAERWYRKSMLGGNREAGFWLTALLSVMPSDSPSNIAPTKLPDFRFPETGKYEWADAPSINGSWVDVKPNMVVDIARNISQATALEGHAGLFEDLQITAMRMTSLECYPSLSLVDVQFLQSGTTKTKLLSAITSDNGAVLLDGSSRPLRALNMLALNLDTEAAKHQYLKLYCEFIYIENGPFSIVSTIDSIPFETEEAASAFAAREIFIHPPSLAEVEGRNASEFCRINACVLYGETLFQTQFSVSLYGGVEMLSDSKIVDNLRVCQRSYERFFRTPLVNVSRPDTIF